MGRRDRALSVVSRLGALLLLAGVLVPAIAGAASVTGRVVFRGEVPALPAIPVAQDHAACGEAVPTEALAVAPGSRGVKGAVVFLEGLARPADAPPPAEVTLENRRCRFVPHVLAVSVGTELAIVNADPVLHNLRAWGEGRRAVFNVVQPTQGQVTRRTIKRPGVATLTCDTHTHMLGYLLAFEHPYFAVTGEDGSFRIDDVPPGTYRLSMWHEGWTVLKRDEHGRPTYDAPHLAVREVTVPPPGAARVLFELAARP